MRCRVVAKDARSLTTAFFRSLSAPRRGTLLCFPTPVSTRSAPNFSVRANGKVRADNRDFILERAMRAEARGSRCSIRPLFYRYRSLSCFLPQGAFGGQWNARQNGMHLHNDPTNLDRMSRLRCDQSARINRVSMIERGSRERCVRRCVPLFFLFLIKRRTGDPKKRE